MEEKGWVTSHEEQAGNRPTRKVFSITETGMTELDRMIRSSLGQYVLPVSSNLIALSFMSRLPADETLILLKQQRDEIQKLYEQTKSFLQEYEKETGESFDSHALILHNQFAHLETELIWIDRVIEKQQKRS
jgi:DNA-binding PadR family transcriptional regulator